MNIWDWLKKLPGPQIKVTPPGPKSREIIERGKRLLATSTREEFVIARQEGDLVWDADGNIYIDFFSGIAVANVGHSNPEVIEAIKQQLSKALHTAPHDFYDELQVKAAESLTAVAPISGDKKVFFANSGTESVECAMKVAMRSQKRYWFIAFSPCFHGRTLGSLSLTASKPVHRKHYFFYPYVLHVPYSYCYRCVYKMDPSSCDAYCAKIIEEWVFENILDPSDVAAIFVEPISGEGGYVVPHPKFIPTLRKICDKYGILLVDDEVQAGFARTGKWWGIQHFGVEPDIMTTAKAIANGLPLGACIFRAKYDFSDVGAHSSTFGGNALALAACCKVIEIINREKLWERAARLGEHGIKYLRDEIGDEKIVGEVRGLGLMIGIEIVKDKDSKEYAPKIRNEILMECWKNGLLIFGAGKSAIRIAPSLVIREEIFEKGLEILASAIKNIAKKH